MISNGKCRGLLRPRTKILKQHENKRKLSNFGPNFDDLKSAQPKVLGLSTFWFFGGRIFRSDTTYKVGGSKSDVTPSRPLIHLLGAPFYPIQSLLGLNQAKICHRHFWHFQLFWPALYHVRVRLETRTRTSPNNVLGNRVGARSLVTQKNDVFFLWG